MTDRKITIIYDGEPDDEIDTRIAKVLEYDLNFEWIGQGYNIKTNKRDISFKEHNEQKTKCKKM